MKKILALILLMMPAFVFAEYPSCFINIVNKTGKTIGLDFHRVHGGVYINGISPQVTYQLLPNTTVNTHETGFYVFPFGEETEGHINLSQNGKPACVIYYDHMDENPSMAWLANCSQFNMTNLASNKEGSCYITTTATLK